MKKVFADCGEKVSYFPKILPLYPKLIKFHNNIVIASNVNFITHDAIHVVLNNMPEFMREGKYMERVGCIEIMDNVFIGANTTILYGTKIGSNVIVGANTLVIKDLESNSIYAGIPAKRIGSFDDYIKKRKLTEQGELVSISQKMTQEEADKIWRLFHERH